MNDSKLTFKQQWYDIKTYKEEIAQFIKKKRNDFNQLSTMEENYEKLYKTIFSGTVEEDVERFPHSAEMFKTYKSSIIEANLGGYSALLVTSGNDPDSILKAPEVKRVLTEQFKSMSLLENLSGDTVDDWILKGEAVGIEKLNEVTELYRVKNSVIDEETGEKVMQFDMKTGVTTRNLDFERIDPLDFFVDALDYQKDPKGCAKIIRSWIDASTLLSSNEFPMLTKEDKISILTKATRNGESDNINYVNPTATDMIPTTYNSTDKARIEVLTYYGDYVTTDNKVLKAIKAVIIEGMMAYLDYDSVNTPRIIYAAYKVDRQTHRGISPLMCADPVNRLVNRAVDLLIKNVEDTSVPIMLYQKGSLTQDQINNVRTKKQCEYNSIDNIPTFFSPPAANPVGIELLSMILQENKNVLGLNNYLAGDTTGAVRTASESSILFQKANARMRVETDVFSYRFLLPLFTAFYGFNRELALMLGEPLDPIFADPSLNVSISTNASKADEEGELNRLMQMLNLPIAQMIFSNLSPEQVSMAIRYLMAKAQLTDGDNLLELLDAEGNRTYQLTPDRLPQQRSRNNNSQIQYTNNRPDINNP